MDELKSGCLPMALTEDDWQVIAVSLARSKSPRANELSQAIFGWQSEIARTRIALLRELAAFHRK